MTAPIITADMLRAKGACKGQVALFERTFPEGAKVAVANARKYGALFDVSWAASNLLKRPAWEAYKAVERPAWEAYKAERAVAFARAYIAQERGQ